MRKGLDLIKRQQPEIIDGFPTGNIYIGVTKEELTELEDELKRLNELEMECNRLSTENQYLEIEKQENEKALEIIEEKKVNFVILRGCDNVEEYNKHPLSWKKLTQEEWDFIMDVVINEK